MPITKSAKKALRSSMRKRGFNLKKKAAIVDSRRSLNKAISSESKDAKNFVDLIAKYYSALDKAVKTKFIHKGKADRLKSRMEQRVSKLLGYSQKNK